MGVIMDSMPMGRMPLEGRDKHSDERKVQEPEGGSKGIFNKYIGQDFIPENASKTLASLEVRVGTLPCATRISYEELVHNTKRFIESTNTVMPTQDNGLESLFARGVPKGEIEQNALYTYPLVTPKVFRLAQDFLTHKRAYGSAIEKKMYENRDGSNFK